MAINRVYLGTWLPRTHIHLAEIYSFLKTGFNPNLDPEQTHALHQQLHPSELVFKNAADFDQVRFVVEDITVTITEDGVIVLILDTLEDIPASVGKIESFYATRLGPALAHLFSRGAPLPQTLVDIQEAYPKIFVGENISHKEAQAIFQAQDDDVLSQVTSDDVIISYGKTIEIISTRRPHPGALSETFITNLVFTQAYSDLLRRYLAAHRTVWSDISLIKESQELRYKDFPAIRIKILSFLKTISFIETRLQQMQQILLARKAVVPAHIQQQLANLGLERFSVLASSSSYFSKLWQMTADYANSTLILFESLVSENTQRELRLLQQITVAGMLVGFFGMNIAFPWEERWPAIFPSSFIVLGVIILGMSIFYLLHKWVINNRHFRVTSNNVS